MAASIPPAPRQLLDFLQLTAKDMSRNKEILFTVDERPPLYISFVCALQQMMANMMGPVLVVYLTHGIVCAGDNQLLFAELLSTTLFLMGVCTLIQTCIGIRLPILQGSSITFIAPIAAMMKSPQWKCPAPCEHSFNETLRDVDLLSNGTLIDVCEMRPWIPRINEISGSLACASLVEVFLGASGLVGVLTNHVGPLTIVPTITLVGLSMAAPAANTAGLHFGIAIMVPILYFCFALVMRRINIPMPSWSRGEGFKTRPYPLFRMFPMLLSISITWLFCYILTITNVFPNDPKLPGYKARTDIKVEVTHTAPWFFVPYPGRTGFPTVGAGIFVGMLAATMTSVVESIGDYYTTAKICRVREPPKHAMNRGIAMEGFGALLNGLFGVMHATTSYTSVVGDIGITGVASRFCLQLTACLLIVCGIIGKIGAFLSILPDPIIGGAMIILFSIVFAVGLMPLDHLDLRSSRNTMILGTSILLGLIMPMYVNNNPDAIKSGNETLDQVTSLFLSTAICVGGVTGFILDNIIPGTLKERGIIRPQSEDSKAVAAPLATGDEYEADVYDLPYVTNWLKKKLCCTFIPFLPSYQERPLCKRKCKSRPKKKDETSNADLETGVFLSKDDD